MAEIGILLLSVYTSCARQKSSQKSASNEELSEIADKLFGDWYAYLIRCENLFGSMRWALSYLDPFFENHSWSSLQIAWAAMNSASLSAEIIEPPETKMTSDDYDRLVQYGKDVSSYWLAIDSIQALRDSVLGDYNFYKQCLNKPSEAIFLSDELASFEQWAHTMQQICDAYLHCFSIETDYLLLSLGDIESSVNLNEAIAENCPQITAWHQDNPQDQGELLDLLAIVQNEMKTLIYRNLSSVVGQMTSILDREKEFSAELDTIQDIDQYVARKAADALELVDFPTALPYPDWWIDHDTDFMYLWDDDSAENEETEPQAIIMPGDKINVPPNQYLVKWSDVSKEEYLTYILQVQRNQTIAQDLKKEKSNGAYITYYESESVYFSLIWDDDEVTFMSDGSVCLAPLWYTFLHHIP